MLESDVDDILIEDAGKHIEELGLNDESKFGYVCMDYEHTGKALLSKSGNFRPLRELP